MVSQKQQKKKKKGEQAPSQAASLLNFGYDVLETTKKTKEKREQAFVLLKVDDGVVKTIKNNEKRGA
jgi:hypothetical protein